MYEIGTILLIETRGLSYIRRVFRITPAGSFKTKDFIINKEGKVRGDCFSNVSILTKEQAEDLRLEWKVAKNQRHRVSYIINFDTWASMSPEDVQMVYNIISKYKED